MTLGRRAADGLEFLITALSTLDGQSDYRRPSGKTVPWFMVSDAPSGVVDKITDAGIYTVHTFHRDFWDCKRYATEADDLILSLGPPIGAQERITLADNRVVYADEIKSSLRPHYQFYSDDLTRYVARYAIKFRLL